MVYFLMEYITTYYNILYIEMEFIVSFSMFLFFHVFIFSINKLENIIASKMHRELF